MDQILLVDQVVVEVLLQLVVDQAEQEIHLLLVLLKVHPVDLVLLDDMAVVAVVAVEHVVQLVQELLVDLVQK